MSKTYRDIREDVLYEQERALLPAAQEAVERELEITKLRKYRDQLDQKYEQIRKDRTGPLLEFRNSLEPMPIQEAIDQYRKLVTDIEIIDEQLQDERVEVTDSIRKIEQSNQPAARTYVLSCTKEDCKGMLSSEGKNAHGNYVCSICDATTCHECRMGIEEDVHECDPDILETVKLMSASSKPCPSCSIPIFKISGCNQMFCTECHASFDWRTLRLNNGAVHNPHHAEWLRTNHNRPREVADVQCGREPSLDMCLTVADRFEDAIEAATDYKQSTLLERKQKVTDLYEYMRVSVHHHFVTIPSLSRERSGQMVNHRMRINLLMGIMDEASFRREIQKRDKASSKRNELLQTVLTYRDALADIVAPFVERGVRPYNEWEAMLAEVRALELYVNNCFITIGQTYGSAAYEISSDRSIR
jgi:hypothetical protein